MRPIGNFYVNHTVRASRKRVVASLRGARRTAFVSTTCDGYTVLFDRECDRQDVQQIDALGKLISGEISCPVLAVLNHDDDLLCYWLFDGGALVEHYESDPTDFDNGPMSEGEVAARVTSFRAKRAGFRVVGAKDEEGPAEALDAGTPGCAGQALCRLLGRPDALPRLRTILAGKDYRFAVMRHQELVDELGLPTCGVGAGYGAIADGMGPDDLDDDRLVHVG